MTHDIILDKVADLLSALYTRRGPHGLTASIFQKKIGVTLIRPVKSLSYLELASCDGLANVELVLHD